MEKCNNRQAGIETAIQVISGKWITPILYQIALNETIRFNELQRNIPNITKKMLTMKLKELEYHQIIERTVYPEVPVRVEYKFTEHGKKLEPLFRLMSDWGELHIEHLEKTYGDEFSYEKLKKY